MRRDQIEMEEAGISRPLVRKYSKAQKRFVMLPKYIPPRSAWKEDLRELNRIQYRTYKDSQVSGRAKKSMEVDDDDEDTSENITQWRNEGDPNLDASDTEETQEEVVDKGMNKNNLPPIDIPEEKKVMKIDKRNMKETVEILGMALLDKIRLEDIHTGERLLPNLSLIV